MKTNINGIAVYTYGDPKNKPIVFVHGFPYDHTMWEGQVKELQNEYYCVTYDVRGLGKSYIGDGQYTMEFYVDDLFMVIKEMKLRKPILCGLSMGGYIALRAIERNQNKFRALILCDTRAEADNNEGKIKRSANIDTINTRGLETFINKFVPTCFAKEAVKDKEEYYTSTLEKAHRNNPTGVKGAILAIMSRTDTTHVLPEIKIPTLVLCGSFDRLTPHQTMRKMAEQIPGSEFAIIPLSGHMSPVENPGAVNDLIKGFLKRRI
jgi:pimeloyl-ACP methyl ester carboxylesterase